MSNNRSNYSVDQRPGDEDDRRHSRERSRSRSPIHRRGSRRSRSKSYSRSRSPPERRGSYGGRRRSSPPHRGRGYRGRSRSYSVSRSRSPPSSRGGWSDRDRGDRGFRDDDRRGPPLNYGTSSPRGGYSDDRGGYGGRGAPSFDYRGSPPTHRGSPPRRSGYGDSGYDDRGGSRNDRGGYNDRRSPPRAYRGPGPSRYDPYRDPYGPRGGPPPPGVGGSRDNGGSGGRRGDRRPRDEDIPGISLLVRNIGPQITNQDLGVAFGRIGDVRDVYIPRDYHSQQPKGFAFIEYANPEQAREARDEMDRFKIKGCELEVVFAQERRKSPNEMRGRVVNQQNAGQRRERSTSFERHQKQRGREDDMRSSETRRNGVD